MKDCKKWGKTIQWAIEDAVIVLVVIALSFRFLFPVRMGLWSGGFRQWMLFLKFAFQLWVMFEISRHHTKDEQVTA
jgi:hypothetical protein